VPSRRWQMAMSAMLLKEKSGRQRVEVFADRGRGAAQSAPEPGTFLAQRQIMVGNRASL